VWCQPDPHDTLFKQEKDWRQLILAKALKISNQKEMAYRFSISELSQWKNRYSQLLHTLSGTQDLDYSSLWQSEHLTVRLKIISELGYVYLWDSLLVKQKDEQTVRYDVSVAIRNNWQVSLNSTANTPLYRMVVSLPADSTGRKRWLSGDFLTPLKAVLSLGIRCDIAALGNIQLGLSSLKVTYVRNRRVFDAPGIATFHGIEPGHSWLWVYGLSSTVDFRKEISPHLSWELYLLAFLPKDDPVNLNLKNLFLVKAGQVLKASIKTNIVYDRTNPVEFQMENLITIGFQLHAPK
jgi:hypothetical protein